MYFWGQKIISFGETHWTMFALIIFTFWSFFLIFE